MPDQKIEKRIFSPFAESSESELSPILSPFYAAAFSVDDDVVDLRDLRAVADDLRSNLSAACEAS